MKIKFTIALLFGGLVLLGSSASAQNVGLKTNLLYWGTATPNFGVEFGLGKRTTLDLIGTYNPWSFSDNAKFKHFSIQPEIRFWNCERFNRGFWGVHATYGQYNVGNIDLPLDIFPSLKTDRYQGYMVGAGVSYGYQWYLAPKWNLEATIGVGYLYLNYDRYECQTCGKFLGGGSHHYFGPTKIGLSFIYLFKSKK